MTGSNPRPTSSRLVMILDGKKKQQTFVYCRLLANPPAMVKIVRGILDVVVARERVDRDQSNLHSGRPLNRLRNNVRDQLETAESRTPAKSLT